MPFMSQFATAVRQIIDRFPRRPVAGTGDEKRCGYRITEEAFTPFI